MNILSLPLIFALFPSTNVMQLSKQSLVRRMRFHGYHCPDDNTHIKNGRSFKKYLKITPTIYINPNSYSFRIMLIRYTEKWSPKKSPSKIVLRQKNTRKFKRLFHFYQLIQLHTQKNVWRFVSKFYVCCRVLGFHILTTSEYSTHTTMLDAHPTIFRFWVSRGPIFRGSIFRWPIFRGPFFPAAIFPGTIFLGDHFSGIRLYWLSYDFYHLLHQWMKIQKSDQKLRQGHKLVRLPWYSIKGTRKRIHDFFQIFISNRYWVTSKF